MLAAFIALIASVTGLTRSGEIVQSFSPKKDKVHVLQQTFV